MDTILILIIKIIYTLLLKIFGAIFYEKNHFGTIAFKCSNENYIIFIALFKYMYKLLFLIAFVFNQLSTLKHMKCY